MDQDTRHLADAEALGWTEDEFSEDLGRGAPPGPRPPGHHEAVAGATGALSKDERDRLTILAEGVPLDGGSTYVDLDDPAGPFTAEAGQVAEPGRRLVSKRDTDYELWNRLVGRDRPE